MRSLSNIIRIKTEKEMAPNIIKCFEEIKVINLFITNFKKERWIKNITWLK